MKKIKRSFGPFETINPQPPDPEIMLFLKEHPHLSLVATSCGHPLKPETERAMGEMVRQVAKQHLEQPAPKPKVAMEYATKVPLECWEQAEFVNWVASNYPVVWETSFAVPNGEYRRKSTAARLKGQGVKSGVSDLVFLFPRGRFHGLVVEMKRRKGSKTSIEQVNFLSACSTRGYSTAICKGQEEAKAVFLTYISEGEPHGKL